MSDRYLSREERQKLYPEQFKPPAPAKAAIPKVNLDEVIASIKNEGEKYPAGSYNIVRSIDDLISQLKSLQKQFDSDYTRKQREVDSTWKKEYERAKEAFNKRNKEMLPSSKPIYFENKHHALLALGIFILTCLFFPLNMEIFFTSLILHIIPTFFIWVIIAAFIVGPYMSLTDKTRKHYHKAIQKDLEDIKRKDYPILLESSPMLNYQKVQNTLKKRAAQRLKQEYPIFGYLINHNEFASTIKNLEFMKRIFKNGRANTLEEARTLMINYYTQEIEEIDAYFKEKEEMRRPVREYQEKRLREEKQTIQRQREEYARRAEEDAKWAEKQNKKSQENYEREQRTRLEEMAAFARQDGKDRDTVRYYDDQLGRSYHERREEDRKYEYRENDDTSDIGGTI